jgi:hypothetical protein
MPQKYSEWWHKHLDPQAEGRKDEWIYTGEGGARQTRSIIASQRHYTPEQGQKEFVTGAAEDTARRVADYAGGYKKRKKS